MIYRLWSARASMHLYVRTFALYFTSARDNPSSQDMIKKQIEQHANYSLKTEYSKEKYKKRKEAKYVLLWKSDAFLIMKVRYSKIFTTVEPTLFNVCEYWFLKDQNRLRDLRVDSLSQVLNLANIRPGGRYIAIDDASGMIVSGILERMGGQQSWIRILLL